MGRHVALKVLPQKLLVDAKYRRRFEREAKAAAKLHHTNIVPVFGVGEHDGLPYYVMQFIQGTGLDVVPLPGDAPLDVLAALVGDVAALAVKLHKPLSARLFPIPGKAAGDVVQFTNPFLTDSVVMPAE